MAENPTEIRNKLENSDWNGLILWRQQSLAEAKEARGDEPFEIRGHHIPHYALLVTGTKPYDLAQDSINIIKNTTNYPPGYYKGDVIGENFRDEFVFSTLSEALFERFCSAKSETTIKLIGESDNICKLCKVGHHCKANAYDKFYESKFIAGVVFAAKEIGYSDELKIEKVEYTDIPVSDYSSNIALKVEMPKFVFEEACKQIKDVVGHIDPSFVEGYLRAHQDPNKPLIDNQLWYKDFVENLSGDVKKTTMI